MPPIRQASFAKGELSPLMWSRSDYAGYASGLRRLHNFVVTPMGAAANRPGSRFVAETKGSGAARLVQFKFSETETLLLVFTDLAVRFYSYDPVTGLPGPALATGWPAWDIGTTYAAGDWVTYGGETYISLGASTGAQPDISPANWLQQDEYEIATPYTAAQLRRLRFAQVGDIITVCHPAHPPRELARTDASPLTFTLTAIDFNVPASPMALFDYWEFVGIPAFDPLVIERPRPSGCSISYTASQVTTLQRRRTEWAVTAVLVDDASGRSFETMPFYLAGSQPVGLGYVNGGAWLDFPDQVTVVWDAVTTYDVGVIRRMTTGDSIGGWFISLQGGNLNHEPGLEASREWWTPLLAGNTFEWLYGLPEDNIHGLLFSLTEQKPTISWAGMTDIPVGFTLLEYRLYRGVGTTMGLMLSFDPETTSYQDDGSVAPNYAISPPQGLNPFATENPSVVAFHEQRRCFARTDARPNYVFCSASNNYSLFDEHAPVLSTDGLARELATMTYQEIRALVSGSVLLAFTDSMEWAITGGGDGFSISPASFASRSRTERGSSWVEPIKVGDDEVLFTDGELVHELSLDGTIGKYTANDMTVLSSHLFDEAEIVAWTWARKPWSVVWVAMSDGKLLSFTYKKEHEVAGWAWHDTQGLVEDVCCVREGKEDAVYLVVKRTVESVERRYIERLNTRKVTDARLGLFLDSALSFDGGVTPASTFSGLDHLEGMTVNALADGSVVRGLVVTAGAVTLPEDAYPDGATVVHVGLAFDAEMELLDVPPSQRQTKDGLKSISHVTLEYEASRGAYVGQKLPPDGSALGATTGMEEWKQRRIVDAWGAIPLQNGVVRIPVTSEWNAGGRAVVKQVDPLPLTILAVTREIGGGGG